MKSDQAIGKILLGVLYTSIAIIIFIALYVVSRHAPHAPHVFLGGEQIAVTIADTPTLQEKGLSGHTPLASDEGMFFIFPHPAIEGFWMKDMLFPLDIIWFDANKKIVDVWQNATPGSYPQVVSPREPAQYVIEVSQGFYTAHHLQQGDTFELR